MKNYNHKKAEKKWAEKWLNEKVFSIKELSKVKNPYYSLFMFPYPSAEGLHIGNFYSFTCSDMMAKFKKLQGYDVFEPVGWDAFGIHSENYALKIGETPQKMLDRTISNFRKQLKATGLSCDWNREVDTTKPEYYKWTQWIFTKLFEKGLAYQKEALLHWCPSCKTVLADEQIEDGVCERCKSTPEKKQLKQWFFKITEYSERLLQGLPDMNWSEITKSAQKNWIGKSLGSEITFKTIKPAENILENAIRRDGAICVLKNDKNEVLVLQSKEIKEMKDLILIQGGIEKGEKPLETAKRELEEETEYCDFEFEKELGVEEFYYKVNEDLNRHRISFQYSFKLKSYKKTPLSEEDIDRYNYHWLSKEEAMKVLIPEHSMIVERAFDGEKNINKKITVFTTRPDTLFGATYMVFAPEHKLIKELKNQIENYDEVEKYIKKSQAKSDLERQENKEKTGIELKGVFAINPANREKIPIWIADYVLANVGTGAIMAVPAHDERDFEFAKKFGLEIKPVIKPRAIEKTEELVDSSLNEYLNLNKPFLKGGSLINSEKFNGLTSQEAKAKITEFVGGKMVTNYRLRDWCISRQRYWGPPVPVIYCEKCGVQAVEEKDLPVKLPELTEDWEPTGDGKGPLANVESFMKTTCPKCGGEGEREADVMDNFLDSAWYFFRYLSHDDENKIFDKELAKKWLPVDFYVGGNEHAVLHLMYTRFITMALHDLDLIDFDNPFKEFKANGMILKDGKKMSKSKGNVVSPEEYGERVSYDALRTYLLFLGPMDENRSFSDDGIIGIRKWIERIWNLKDKVDTSFKDSEEITKKLHKTIKIVTENLEDQKNNTAIARLMELSNALSSHEKISTSLWNKFTILISPFLPMLAEELREISGKKEIFSSGENLWPKYDEKLMVDDTIKLAIQVNGKLRAEIEIQAEAEEEEIKIKALENEDIKKWIEGKEIKKVIYVKGKILNIVI